MTATARAGVRVELRRICKRFAGVEALADVSVRFPSGGIHSLVGENGAGKSTLARIIAGGVKPDSGAMLIDGRETTFHAPREALLSGITMITQELALVPQLSVMENIFLGMEAHERLLLRHRKDAERFKKLMDESGFGLAAGARAGDLRFADRQKVEILRAVARAAKLIVMDEPTASLTGDEVKRLFEVVRDLRARGTTVIFISHSLDQVLELSDTIHVLRDGRLVKSAPAAGETPNSLVTAMLGRAMEVTFPEKVLPREDARVVCRVRDLRIQGSSRLVHFDIREGEILGLAGLIGSGRSEIARAIFGADRAHSMSVSVDGRHVRIRHPRDAIAAGIGMLPESRRDQGLLMRRSVLANITLAHTQAFSRAGIIQRRTERKMVQSVVEELQIRTPSLAAMAETLSGGNQQKLLFAKWLFESPRVLIADEPTRGVDVGAKRSIYELLCRLASQGMAMLLISSELEEILGLAHRVLVIRRGHVVAELGGAALTEDAVLRSAFASDERQPR